MWSVAAIQTAGSRGAAGRLCAAPGATL